MTLPIMALIPLEKALAGPARQGGEPPNFWRRVGELLTLKRLHASSEEIFAIATRDDLTDGEKLQELERLAQREPQQQGAEMLPTTAIIHQNTSVITAAEIARRESADLAADIRRQIMSKPQHIQMLAVSKVLGELIAETVNTRQLGPVEGLLEEIESNLDFDNGMTVRQYARGLAALAEDIRCRLANL